MVGVTIAYSARAHGTRLYTRFVIKVVMLAVCVVSRLSKQAQYESRQNRQSKTWKSIWH